MGANAITIVACWGIQLGMIWNFMQRRCSSIAESPAPQQSRDSFTGPHTLRFFGEDAASSRVNRARTARVDWTDIRVPGCDDEYVSVVRSNRSSMA